MKLSPTKRNLGKVAALLGIYQGLAWAAMSLAAIILHNWSPDLEKPANYAKLLALLLHNHFLSGSDNSVQGVTFIIRPTDFTIFMWIYFLLSVGWFALSVDQLTAIYLKKQRQTKIMIIWGIITLIVSLIDLIFVSLLARDYAACHGILTGVPTEHGFTDEQLFCYLTIGVTMTIAARGYTLWALNLVFAILMFYVSANIARENDNSDSLYANHRIPRVTIPRLNNDRNSEISFPKNGNISPDFLRKDDSVPSFLSRGDKFSY